MEVFRHLAFGYPLNRSYQRGARRPIAIQQLGKGAANNLRRTNKELQLLNVEFTWTEAQLRGFVGWYFWYIQSGVDWFEFYLVEGGDAMQVNMSDEPLSVSYDGHLCRVSFNLRVRNANN